MTDNTNINQKNLTSTDYGKKKINIFRVISFIIGGYLVIIGSKNYINKLSRILSNYEGISLVKHIITESIFVRIGLAIMVSRKYKGYKIALIVISIVLVLRGLMGASL